jgi:hypothetical protein
LDQSKKKNDQPTSDLKAVLAEADQKGTTPFSTNLVFDI